MADTETINDGEFRDNIEKLSDLIEIHEKMTSNRNSSKLRNIVDGDESAPVISNFNSNR